MTKVETDKLDLLLAGLKDLNATMIKMTEKLDGVAEKTIINQQDTIHVKELFTSEKVETKDRFTIAHDSIRRTESRMKWIASSILVPIALSIIAFFKTTPIQ